MVLIQVRNTVKEVGFTFSVSVVRDKREAQTR
jgi:hypothetical protein